ncbi:PatA/PatG family cyanobactin maturation protease [Planktothricoides raciborskii]|uniref:PatA/PatG family cyanobactin maturation protease n=1 Tax=Planktothricoides raciborskii FACHB-1370 TaxID=2949576 RepID=A0ABR8EEF1_9CYAN|nr:PatA/PatG family cyanobactin maturation protease [Planktothricoides raciborskii]MBD2545078.1 PatA/PatG family cyanobactin maturation protease [Planktothricoides raciborskii FACHB-1370]MBD2584266.1 PatA/PatG family cyanobactin maturation protease [Planktothricoides raciborskii FACHB-1261]
MSLHSFAVSLNPSVQVSSTESQYTLGSVEADPTALLTLATTPGITMVLDSLKAGSSTPELLVQKLAELEGQAVGEQFGQMLKQLDERGWLSYTVLPLAVAIPMVDSAELNLAQPYWTQTRVALSRFAYQRPYEGTMVLESPLSKFRVKLLDWRASAILTQLAQPQSLGAVTPPPYLGAETAYQFLNLLWVAGFLTADPEPPSLQLWDFHNLLFHSRSRGGRHDYPLQDTNIEQWSDFPVVKPPMSDRIVPLPHPNLGALKYNDATLTEAIERRKSIRKCDEAHPVTVEQLSELLYRTARIKDIRSVEEYFGENWREILDFDADIDYGELASRPYPGGGAMYELEIYPVVRRCEGLDTGLYHYDPLNHQLEQIIGAEDNIFALSGYKLPNNLPSNLGTPQVLLVITARFGRLFRKYRSLAYSLVLKHVGVLQQNFYLVATNMGLAPCAWGYGDSDGFGQAAGLDYVEESAVGEFTLSSLPKRDLRASGVELAQDVDASEESGEVGISVSKAELTRSETEPDPADVGFLSSIQPTETLSSSDEGLREAAETVSKAVRSEALETSMETTDAAVSGRETESVNLSALSESTTEVMDSKVSESQAESDIIPDEIESATISASEVESSASPALVALHPHDLDDRVPGLAYLRNQTLGDPRITIVVLEGNPDHSLSCFQSPEISKVFPYWHDTPEPFSAEDYAKYRAIDDSDRTKQEKEEALKAAFPEPQIVRLKVDDHTCHVTSIIVGQENTPSAGIAPHCRLINLPVNSTGIPEESIGILNLARAFEQALNLGANIIHCGFCRPTQTCEGEELLAKAVQKCLDNNILIVGPAGNGLGEYWCLPGVLPGVLPVGAMDLGSPPAHYSNWGRNYTQEGIMAPGDDIWGAQLGSEKPKLRTGTSGSAPIVTGIAALLMSLQLQQGKPIDAEAVRMALLNTAIPCDPKRVEEPERCMRGFVNIAGAMEVLFGRPSVTISFAGDQVTRTEWAGYALPTPTAMSASSAPSSAVVAAIAENAVTDSAIATVQESAEPTNIETSTAFAGDVYALGTLGYDFGDEARRDTFKQLMPPFELDGIMVPPDPYDARQVVEHLDRNPDEARSLIWTLNLEQNTLYALEPKGPFASDVYEIFLQMLAGQLEPETSDEFVERISVAARRTNRTVELFSGEVVPVVTVHDLRGMYGWTVNALINPALASVRNLEPDREPIVREAISAFLNRVYYDLHNLGQTSRDRALNFATTNIFQAVSVFAEAIASGRQLDTISVEKSPYCRIRSDCWDVLLTFFDPDSSRRSRRVFRFTLDVAANLPVTIGSIKRWSIPGQSNSQ